MDKDINTNRKLNEWIHFQKQLLEEKNFLTDVLSKLDKQIHALQVKLYLKKKKYFISDYNKKMLKKV